MTVKFEIKDQLAKLLATEDLVVEHKKVLTASFNVSTRVLVLPMWEKASNNVYDMLVGHEVGHALFTPNVDIASFKAPSSYINVIEDARIEKLIKRKFPGLCKSFFRGYWELHEQDFFEVQGLDSDEITLIDRINLYYKGSKDMVFADDEKVFVERTGNTETFEEVCELAEEIHAFMKEQKEKREQEKIDDTDFDMSSEMSNDIQKGSGESSGEDVEESEEEGEGESSHPLFDEEQQTEGGSSISTDDLMGGDHFEEPDIDEAVTDTNLSKNLIDNLLDLESNRMETTYLSVPSVNTETVIVPPQDIWDYFDRKTAELEAEETHYYNYQSLEFSCNEYETFKQSAKKEVNYLVKEFECRKSATAYARSTTARTGVLDTSKLHTYKFNEDLFKKITVLPEGKNHGLIFILDWSGSMNFVLKDTVKQLLNLVWFCKKVKIPFNVYAFTNEWYRNCDDGRILQKPYGELIHQDFVDHELRVSDQFNLLNMISSDSPIREFDQHCKNLFCLVENSQSSYNYPRLSLSGTPLNEAIISLHTLIPEFKSKYKVEKLNTIILTDGESQSMSYNKAYVDRQTGETHNGTYSVSSYSNALRDRKLGRTYNMKNDWSGLTKVLLQNISEKFTDVNFIGIRLLTGSDARRFIANSTDYDYDTTDKLMKIWKKQKSIVLDNTGYRKYFGMSSTALSNDNTFDVQEDATKTQIKRAFSKSLNAKKLNKKILSEFMELIA